MSALTFALRSIPPQRVDLSSLVPANLEGRTREQILAMPLHCGNRSLAVGDLFDVRTGEVREIVFEGGCDRLDGIGTNFDGASLSVHGEVGAYLARSMRGGRIEVNGNAGAFAGSAMLDGAVHIRGNAGDFLGAPLPGEMQGMRGGTIVVDGDTGDRAGDRMRRGTILVTGRVGGYAGSRMIAGTIAALGGCGSWPGYLMRRGTLWFGVSPAEPGPAFADCGVHALPMLPMLVRSWQRIDPAFGRLLGTGPAVRRMMGDLGAGGMGEILFPPGSND
jgi:formylmethanofuran dehydrogenase subunit C